MWKIYWVVYKIAQNPKNIFWSRIFGWSCQLLIGVYAWFAGNYFLNDSISYLTLAENVKEFGVFSQSYQIPIVPDIQRTPGYPMLLAIFPLPLLFFIQHFFSFISQEYWAKTLDVSGKHASANLCRFIIPWIPYPMLFASLIAAESIYISLLAFFTYEFVCLYYYQKYSNVFKLVFLAILLTYIKPITLVLFFSLMLYYFFSQPQKVILASLIFIAGIFPWYLRNYLQTGYWTFSTLGAISTHYGRTGGMGFQSKNDAERVAVADYFAGKEANKKYISDIPTEENEVFEFSTTQVFFTTAFKHPLAFFRSQVQGFWGQLSGIAWKTAKMMTENYFFTVLIASIQALFCLHLYFFTGLAFISRKKNTWIPLILFAGLFVFITQNAVWADGRYRMILDPWALLVTLYFWQPKSHEI